MRPRSSFLLGLLVTVLPLACSASRCGAIQGPGKIVSLTAAPAARAELAGFEAERAATESMTTAELERRSAVPFQDGLPYAPLDATGLADIEAKGIALAAGERARLGQDGFAILPAVRQTAFGVAYADAFRRHLPVYISADAILFAVHKSFDTLLKYTEQEVLVRDLVTLVSRMRETLKKVGLPNVSAEVVGDVDDYLAVAASLLAEEDAPPVASGHAGNVKNVSAFAHAADGPHEVLLFGGLRDLDFSQFKPRGHYQGTPELERYFRAVIWLSRTDLRAIEVLPNGTQAFRRRQLEVALVLRDLMDDDARAAWTRVDTALEAFVGERDEMNVRDLDTLSRELGIETAGALGAKSDQAILGAIARTGLGQQRIASQLMEVSPQAKGTLPLHTSFAFLNQRYTLDSHVLSNVSYDRVQHGNVRRMMPDPLDVAYAALDNDGAAELLRGEIDRFSYAPDLHMMRFLGDAHGDDYWNRTLYSTWSSALRALSPTPPRAPASAPTPTDPWLGLPAVARTHAWNARILNTQLASWAELRHDTILYAKESYSASPMCEFPDAYVDPYPEFFRRISLHARQGKTLAHEVMSAQPALENAAQKYFERLDQVATKLAQMAESERAGNGISSAQLAFVNEMISTHPSHGCGGPPSFSGWYGDLFVDQAGLYEFAPTIADVHTQATDENGATVGRVLHVGTGWVNGLVVTVDSCGGAKAYAGYVSSYYEKITTRFEREDDAEWATELRPGSGPPAPTWLRKVAGR